MSIRIITDSGSDIDQKTAARWGVKVLPLTVRFGDEEFKDGITLSADDMYNRMIENGEIPKTSQVPPFDYEAAFREAVDAGDEVICIALSSGMSGCYQSAVIAAQQFGDKVSVVDSLNVSSSQYVMVRFARALMHMDKSREEIVRRLEQSLKHLHVIALPSTLEYVEKGGRIPKSVAKAGSILNIKPIITSGAEGKVELIGKGRGTASAYKQFTKLVMKTGGINPRLPVCLAYSGVSDAPIHDFMEAQPELFDGLEGNIQFTQIGPTVGTYTGPGAIALGYYSN